MNSLLVLGIIPGTDIAISFQAWLGIAAVLLAVGLLFRHQIRRWLQRNISARRLPLPASQLHLRIRPTAR